MRNPTAEEVGEAMGEFFARVLVLFIAAGLGVYFLWAAATPDPCFYGSGC